MTGKVATAEVDVDAPRSRVWQALTDPDQIAEYMMGSRVDTDWQPGSPITWTGEWEGKPYEDKGEVVEVDRERRLVVTHFSPLSGADDKPENYHRLTYELSDTDGGTHLSLSQDNNASDEEAERSQGQWEQMLQGLKTTAEGG